MSVKGKKIAEPDYNFRLECVAGKDIIDRVIFENDIQFMKCTKGEALITINSQRHIFVADTNFLLVDGAIFKVLECSEDCVITILSFSPNFLHLVYPMLDSKAIETMTYSAPDLYEGEDIVMSDLIFTQLVMLYHNKGHAYRDKLSVNLTINYIYEIYERTHKFVVNSLPIIDGDHKNFLIDEFYKLCIDMCHIHRNIDFYADKLNITSRYLHKICRTNLQSTPKQCIDYIVSAKAKKMLLTSKLTNQQISNELNFPDQTTFCQYFKRVVGMSPSEFRRITL